MQADMSSSKAAGATTAVSAWGSVKGASATAARAVKEQGAVLFALHNVLCQHQRSVNQAFTSLDNACRSLVASLVADQAAEPRLSTGSASISEMATRSSLDSYSPSSVSAPRRFAQLLRQVEALHEFLFTNLYVHQRECALQLLNGVERAVVEAEPTRIITTAEAGPAATAEGENRTVVLDAADREDLRSQIAQLRYRLSNAPDSYREGRIPLPTVDAAARLFAGPSSHDARDRYRFAPAASLSASPWAEGIAPSLLPPPSGSSAGATVTHATVSTAAGEPSSLTAMPVWPRALEPRPQPCFALSSTFVRAGEGSQCSLGAVCFAVQRHLHFYGVVLRGAATAEVNPTAEMQQAQYLGCKFLVVPHAYRGLYPLQGPIAIASDRDVLAYDRRKRSMKSGEDMSLALVASPPLQPALPVLYSDSDDEAELMNRGVNNPSTSSLEELFRTLEEDLPADTTDFASPWSPSANVSPHDALSAEGDEDEPTQHLVVQRAALKRQGRPSLTTKWKTRPRLDTQSHLSQRHTYSSCTPMNSAADPTATSNNISAELQPMARKTLMDPLCNVTETAVQSVVSDNTTGEVDVYSLTLPHAVGESQHIGITQHDPPHIISTSSEIPAAPTSVSEAAEETSISPQQQQELPQPVFQISNSVKYLKPQLIEAIELMGGLVDLSSGYSRECRFLITAEGITERTEKYLGACAAAVYIVPPRYVFDSQRRGYWLIHRVHEYDMSPQRRAPHQPRRPPIFRSWRVVLITCRSAAARGVRAALLAGGCTQATAFVVDLTAEMPISAAARTHEFDDSSAVEGVVEGLVPTSVIAAGNLASATHILVECSSLTAQGHFQLPDWVPTCVRRPEYTSRIFTLELLYFCLCSHPERLFDEAGLLCDEGALTPACRVEPT